MSTVSEQLLSQLKWRYATKQFDPAKKISDSDWAALEEVLTLSPSSYGIQPYQFVVVKNQELKEKLLPLSWKQKQIVDASHIVVFAAKNSLVEKEVDHFIERMASVRGVSADSLKGYKQFMMQDLINGPRAAIIAEWSTRQAYIAIGNLMTAAAILNIDTCPIEGFDPIKYDEVLGLPAKGLHSVVVCAVGYRAAGDKYATATKVRMPVSELFDYR